MVVETHREQTDRLIAEFLSYADAVRLENRPETLSVIRGFMIDRALALKERIAGLEKDIDECWDYLSAHPDHPQYTDLDQQVADMIMERDAIAIALSDGETRWHRPNVDEGVIPTVGEVLTPESVKAHAWVREWNASVFQRAKEAREHPPKKTKRKPRGNNDGNSGKYTYGG